MTPAHVRALLLEALEFFGYFVLTAGLGGATYWLVQYRPHSEAKWYILASAGAAIGSALYAARMYYLFRLSFRRRKAPILAPGPSPVVIVPAGPRLSWSERIAAERAGLPQGAPPPVAAVDAEEDDAHVDPAMSIDAIKARIADRMKLEDKEQEEAKRIIDKFGGRS